LSMTPAFRGPITWSVKVSEYLPTGVDRPSPIWFAFPVI